MKAIGKIDSRADADLFQTYLQSRQIACQVDIEAGQYEVWVYDYDQVEEARSQLQDFLAAADRTSYEQAAAGYVSEQKQQLQKKQVQFKRTRKSRADIPFLHQVPATLTLVGVCLLVYFLTSGGRGNDVTRALRISAFPPAATAVDSTLPLVSYGRLPEVASGQVWRLVTPIFMHSSLPHIFFNLLWLVPLGGAIEFRQGTMRLLMLVLILALISNLAQFVYAGPRFAGISGVDAGLFGYLLVYTHLAPEEGLYVDSRTTLVMLIYLGLCLTPVITGTANGSHLAGLATGIAAASLSISLGRLRRAL